MPLNMMDQVQSIQHTGSYPNKNIETERRFDDKIVVIIFIQPKAIGSSSANEDTPKTGSKDH